LHTPTLREASSSDRAPAEQTPYVWGISAIAALGGLLFGYDWVVIGGARQFYETYFGLTSAALIGWANSCALCGCLIGSITAGYLSDHYGRRKVLLFAAVLFGLSSVLTGWSFSFVSFVVWRIAGGIAIGLSSNVSPLYIAEISPANLRGRLVSLNQFAIVFGILLAQIVNWRLARPMQEGMSASMFLHSWNVQYGWRWMFTVVAIPSLIFTIATVFLPESPRWLLVNRRRDEASLTLRRIGGIIYAAQEVASIEYALQLAADETSSWKELFRPRIRRIALIGICLAVLQQWTGINTLFNYAAEIYRRAGYGANDIFLNIAITGSINLIFTVLSMLIVDRIGRRWMMLFGCIGIGVSHLLCAAAYHAGMRGSAVLVLTLSAIACYAFTLAPVTWVLISEIFPNRVRSYGVSAAVSALWIAAFVLTYTFPFMNEYLGTSGVFVTYGILCLFGALFVGLYVPETKGCTLEQIEAGIAPAE
jgi:SP family xylose:H+ symportor-like MFS transporter